MKNLFRSLVLTTVALGFITISTNARATVILGEPAHFAPTVGQPLFPAGNLNVFKQYVVGFDVSEHIGDTVEIDLLFTTLKFGGEVGAEFQANFGFEFGLCLGGNADFDMNFQPMVILPDMYPSEIPIPITIVEGLQTDSSHFTTTFPPLGKMYADLILHLEADVNAEACVFGCFDPLSFLPFPLKSCDIPALPSGDKMFNFSKRCDPALDAERYCAIELASFNRNDQNKARMLNVGADNLAEFFAEPYKEFSLGSGSGKTFTANPGDNTITISGNTFPGGSPVRVSSSGTLPLGLKKTQIYYTTAAGNKVSLAKSPGGSAISISSVGDGTHTIKLPDVEEDPDPLSGRYGSLSIAAPTINTDSNDDTRLNTPRSLRSTGAEDVVGAGVDLAQMATDFLFPPVLPPLSDSGSLGPIGWEYTLAALDIGPAVQLQMDFEMTWDLVVTEMTFSNPVRLFTSDGATFPLSSTGTPASSELYADTGAPADTFHLTNTGPHALPLIYLNTSVDGFGKPLPAAQQQAVDITITYKLVPKLHTIVSLPFIGKVSYDVLGASASISRVGDLGFGPIIEGDHKFKLGDFEVYNGGATAIDTSSTQRGTISFTMRSEGPPNFDWNPSQLGRSSTRDWIQKINYPNPWDQGKTNWRELLSSLETGYPGNGLSTLSSAMIDSNEQGPTLRDPIMIESLNVAADNVLSINEHFTSGKPVTKLTVGGLIDNQGTVHVIGDSIMKMGSRESVLCGQGIVQLHGGGTLQGASTDPNAAVCNYNTIEGAGYALDQPFLNAFFSFTDHFQTTTHNMGRIVARGNFGNAGTNQIKLEILAGGSTLNSTWEITTPEGAAVRSGNVPYSSTLTLADGDYVFTIFDNFDNPGFWGGSYTIHSSNGQEIATGGSFFNPSNSKSIYIRNGHFLKTAATTINNQGELGSISGGRLVVDGSELNNSIGSDITASGSGSMIEIRTRIVYHAGQMTTSDGGRIEFYPIRERSAANLLAGRSFREDCGHLFAADLGEIHLQSARVSGGCFSAEGRGSLTTNNSVFDASVIEIGSRFNPSGTFDILGPNRNDNRWRTTGHNIFKRACINNYGTLRVSGEAEFIDSELFANNGKIEVAEGGILRIRENTVATPGASAEAQSQPGCANMTATALLGGIWDVSGQIFVDGAEFKVMGADVAPARVNSGTTNDGDNTPPAYDPALHQYVSTNPTETDPLMRPFDTTRILSEGRPAEVILRGRGSFFQPLSFLEENCGILRVVDGAEFRARGYVVPEGGVGDPDNEREAGDFFNKGQLLVGAPGDTSFSTFKVNGSFNQTIPSASTVIDGFGWIQCETRTYNISGGTLSSARAASVFELNLGDYKIYVESPETSSGVPQQPVIIDIPDEITTIDEGSEITLHGAAVEFAALTDHLRTNNGKLVISGDGALNAPDYLIATSGFFNHKAFTNTGPLHVLGFQSKLTIGNYTQTGDEAETRIGVGAQFLANTIDINGGDFVIEIGSRPGQIPAGNIRMFNDNGGDFGNDLVFDFKDELASENKTVDIGDTWTIIYPSSSAITGIDTFEARLNGAPLPADWLPAGSHLELVPFETSNGPRGLKLRVTPDGGFYDYDAWAADTGLDPDRALADPFRIGARGVDTNAVQFLYGVDGVKKGSPGQYQLVDFIDEGDERFAKFSYSRLFGTDADYELYLSPDLKEWIVAPMILTPSAAAPVLGQLEVVTLKSIYPVTTEKLFFRVGAKLNPDNFELGELPEKPINYDLWLDNFNGWLENNTSPPVSYVVEAGKTLFFSVNVKLNEESEQNIWGGTGPDGERNFIYSDGTELKLAVRHANLLGGSGSGLIKVTFVPTQQTPFIGSLQNEGTPYETESNNLAVEDVPYSYHIELVEKF